MMLNRWIALVLIAVISSTFAAEDEAYKIKKKEFKKQVEYIALVPVQAPAWMKLPPETASAIEADISKRLSKKGYRLLSPDEYNSIRQTMELQVGGIKNTDGTVDRAKLAAVTEHAYRELMFRHDVDAVASIRVRTVGAPFYKDRAEWDGTTQKVKHKGRSNVEGTLHASSIEVSIYDRQENLLYSDRGGIELQMWRDGQALKKLPVNELFQDDKRVKKAVDKAMDDF